MTSRLVLCVALGVTFATGRPALAAPPLPTGAATTHVIDVEITESHGGKTAPAARFLLALTDGRETSLEASAGDAHYRLKLLRAASPGAGPLLYCELDRSERGPAGQLRLKTSSALQLGRRATLGVVIRPDGTRVELAATLR